MKKYALIPYTQWLNSYMDKKSTIDNSKTTQETLDTSDNSKNTQGPLDTSTYDCEDEPTDFKPCISSYSDDIPVHNTNPVHKDIQSENTETSTHKTDIKEPSSSSAPRESNPDFVEKVTASLNDSKNNKKDTLKDKQSASLISKDIDERKLPSTDSSDVSEKQFENIKASKKTSTDKTSGNQHTKTGSIRKKVKLSTIDRKSPYNTRKTTKNAKGKFWLST